MSRRHIVTKQFVTLCPSHQVAVVEAALFELESAVGVGAAYRRAIRRAISRIERKAVEYGVYEKDVNHE